MEINRLTQQNVIFLILADGDEYTKVILGDYHPYDKPSEHFDTCPQVPVYGNPRNQIKKINALRTALIVAGFNVIDA